MCAGIVGVEVETLGDAGTRVGPVDRVVGLCVVVGLPVVVGLCVVMSLVIVVGLLVVGLVGGLAGISGFENQNKARISLARKDNKL